MKLNKNDRFIVFAAVLGVVSVIFENSLLSGPFVRVFGHVLDFVLLGIMLFEFYMLRQSFGDAMSFWKRYWGMFIFLLTFVCLFVYVKFHVFFIPQESIFDQRSWFPVVLSFYFVTRIFMRIKRLNEIFSRAVIHPSQTFILSFMALIIFGTVLLMFPLSCAGEKIGFIDALFTSVSAVCVTGLVVVDTPTAFSMFGKCVILFLIQAGGLGIMLFSSLAAFAFGKRLSYRDRMAVSYALNEKDLDNISSVVKKVFAITFAIELAGMLCLYFFMRSKTDSALEAWFFSLFHSVSAFCNAGFALFSDSLSGFRGCIGLNIVIALLIIAGSLSFAVIADVYSQGKRVFVGRLLKRPVRHTVLNLNSRIVIFASLILVISGTLFIYWFEHKHMMHLSLLQQYTAAFFQAVTLRTAGFNTIDISMLSLPVYIMMMLFMFIGGAAGSTAGGIKVNTLGVLYMYMRSMVLGQDTVTYRRNSVSQKTVNDALFVIVFAVSVIFFSILLLSITEGFSFVKIAFEAFSAFGTVGLSAGITPYLTIPGKLIIIVLMFMGRMGPLSIVFALSRKNKSYPVAYPEAKIIV